MTNGIEHGPEQDAEAIQRIGKEFFDIVALDGADGSPSPYPFTPVESSVWTQLDDIDPNSEEYGRLLRMFMGMRRDTIQRIKDTR